MLVRVSHHPPFFFNPLIFILIKCEQPQDGLQLYEYALSRLNYRLFKPCVMASLRAYSTDTGPETL